MSANSAAGVTPGSVRARARSALPWLTTEKVTCREPSPTQVISRDRATRINAELRRIWETSTGHDPLAEKKVAVIERKMENIWKAIERLEARLDEIGEREPSRRRDVRMSPDDLGPARQGRPDPADQEGVQQTYSAAAAPRRQRQRVE